MHNAVLLLLLLLRLYTATSSASFVASAALSSRWRQHPPAEVFRRKLAPDVVNRNMRTSWTPSEPWSSLSPASASATCLTKCTVLQSSFVVLLFVLPALQHLRHFTSLMNSNFVLISNLATSSFICLQYSVFKYLTYSTYSKQLRQFTYFNLPPLLSYVLNHHVLSDSSILATPCLHNMTVTSPAFTLCICYLTCYYLASSHFAINIFLPAFQGVHGVDNHACDTHQHDRLLHVHHPLLLQPLS